MADKRDILIRLLGEETVAKMTDRAGDGLDRFGDKLDATEKDAKHLDKQIAEVEGNLKTLAVAFARTSDEADRLDISKAIRRNQTELRKLSKAKDLLPGFEQQGEDAAHGFVAKFSARLGPLLTQAPLGGAGAAAGGVLAAVLVPMLSAAVSGAILGGVGVGGVIGGLKLAAQDSRVQAAGKSLAETVVGDLEDSAGKFVQPAIEGIDILRHAWNDVAADVDDAFEASSSYVKPLAEGIAGAVRELGPAVAKAARAGKPVIDEISRGLPRLGKALSDVLDNAADDADEAAGGMRGLFIATETVIRVGGQAISIFSDLFKVVVKLGQGAATVYDVLLGWIPGLGSVTQAWRGNWNEMNDAMKGGQDAAGKAGPAIFDDLMKIAEGATGAKTEVRSLSEILDEFAGKTLDSRAANREFEAAIDDAAEAVKENGRTLDEHTAKGRANQEALDRIARSALANAAAVLALTGDQTKANAVTEEGRKAFIKAATAMGLERDKAIALADKLFAIPNVNRTVKIKVVTKFETHGSSPGEHIIGQGTVPFSAGGMVAGAGPKGVDSVPAILAPGEGVLTADEIDAAGGPAGFERLRSMLRTGRGPGFATGAAGPTGSSAAAGPSRTVIEVRSGGSRLDDLLVEILRRAVNDRGGNVQAVLGGRA